MKNACREIEQKIVVMEIVKDWIQNRLSEQDDIPFERADGKNSDAEIAELKKFVEVFCSIPEKSELERLIFQHGQVEAIF